MNLIHITRRTGIATGLVLASFLTHIDLASAQQKVCVITDESTTVCGIPTTKPIDGSNDPTFRTKKGN